jgi:hypothetical protein
MPRSAFPALLAGLALSAGPAVAQSVLFDFDNAPLHASLPLDLTVGGITAHLSPGLYGYSIQTADVLGFTPQGFAGYIVYPNTVYLSDLMVSYSQPMTDFSILYAPEELACDDSATMRVTGYLGAVLVATNTTTAPVPGTWPTGTLTLTAPAGFDNVVIHYDAPPPTCQDWGPIFMADNMIVTPLVPLIFADGFESGDTSAWSAAVP